MGHPSPEDTEAARLLREMAAQPRQGVLWAQYHGDWALDIRDAFERGSGALRAQRAWTGAAALTRIIGNPGDMVGYVTETGSWPQDVAAAMNEAADYLDPDRG